MQVENDVNKNVEVESLNATFDSIDLGNQDLTAPYRGEFNKPPPQFKGRPDDYYPTTVSSCLCSCLMLFPAYIVCAGVFMAIVTWGIKDARSCGWTQFAVFMLYLAIILILIYIFAAGRKKREREFIEEKIQQQRIEKQQKKEESEKYREFLKKYQKQRVESRVF